MNLWSTNKATPSLCGATALLSLGGGALCSVSPARCAGSSLTYAKRSAAQTLSEVLDV